MSLRQREGIVRGELMKKLRRKLKSAIEEFLEVPLILPSVRHFLLDSHLHCQLASSSSYSFYVEPQLLRYDRQNRRHPIQPLRDL